MSSSCSKWIDLSEAHKQIREELETQIEKFVKYTTGRGSPARSEELPVYLIVAPYGSGKTELLRRLLCYAKERGIPSIYIQLSEFVQYLEKYGKVEQHELPQILHEFFCQRVGKCEYGIILIDEVEEAYERLKQTVPHETTPFRSIYDAVRRGELKIYPILAFGPSSIFKEAASLSGSWRVEVRSLPLIPPSKIPLTQQSPWTPYVKNLIWWIGKGRAGHIYKISKDFNLQQPLTSDKIDLILENYKSQYIIENVPYIEFTELEQEIGKMDEDCRHLLGILTKYVGPVPISYLQKMNIEQTKYKQCKYVIRGRKTIELSQLVEKILHEIRETGRAVTDPHLFDLIKSVFEAWSDHRKILFDKDALLELVDLVKALSVEVYKPEMVTYLSRIDFKALLDDLENYAKEDEPHYAASPSFLIKVYPPIMLNPLIGPAGSRDLREIKEEIFSKFSRSDLLKSMVLSNKLLELLKPESGDSLRIIFIPPTYLASKAFKELAIKSLLGRYEKVLLVLLSREVPSNYEEEWGHLIKEGLVHVATPYEKLQLFLLGLLYNRIEHPEWSPTQFEQQIIDIYSEVFKKWIEGLNLSKKPFESLKSSNFEKYEKEAYQVGEEHARYLWLIASSSDEVVNIFKTLTGQIQEIASSIEKISDVDVKAGFKSVLERGSYVVEQFRNEYLLYTQSYKELIHARKAIHDIWNTYYNVHINNPEKRRHKKDKHDLKIINIIRDFCNTHIKKLNGDIRESLCLAVTWNTVKDAVDGESIRTLVEEVERKISADTKEILIILNNLHKKFEEVINIIQKLTDLESNAPILNTINEKYKLLDKVKNEIEYLSQYILVIISSEEGQLSPGERLLVNEIVGQKIIIKLFENLRESLKLSNILVIDKLSSELYKLSNSVQKVKNLGFDDLSKIIDKDVERILKRSASLKELYDKVELANALVEAYISELENYVNAIKELKKLISEFSKIYD